MRAPQDYSTGLTRATTRQLRGLRLFRVAILGPGLSIGLLVEIAENGGHLDRHFVVGAGLALFATLATFSPRFTDFSPTAMTAIALLDFVTLVLVFDLAESLEVVDALIAIPAMWLGIVLGRRGVLLTGALCVLLFTVPGLVADGSPAGGWHHAFAVVAFALLASAGIAASAEMWDAQLVLLQQTGNELERAMGVKDDFVALVSHELRTPLTSIIGYLDLVADEVEAVPGPVTSHVAAASRNADRLLVLVTDLLGAEQAEREPMALACSPTNLSALVKVSVNDCALRAETARVQLVSDIEPNLVLSVDSARVLQAIDNLLSNAVKYTPPSGRVSVTLRSECGQAVLTVADTGIGITAEDQAGLFNKFFRARNATVLAIPGIGLGLMITRTIVEAHQGTIAVSSQEGVGTSMRVTLPREPNVCASVPADAACEEPTIGSHRTPGPKDPLTRRRRAGNQPLSWRLTRRRS